MRSRLAGIVVLTAALFAAAQPCAGWLSTPQERMACCEEGLCSGGMDHGGSTSDLTQSAADQCCATSEQHNQRNHSQSPERVVSIAPPLVVAVSPITALAIPRQRPERVTAASRSAPLHVLFSVYLV